MFRLYGKYVLIIWQLALVSSLLADGNSIVYDPKGSTDDALFSDAEMDCVEEIEVHEKTAHISFHFGGFLSSVGMAVDTTLESDLHKSGILRGKQAIPKVHLFILYCCLKLDFKDVSTCPMR